MRGYLLHRGVVGTTGAVAQECDESHQTGRLRRLHLADQWDDHRVVTRRRGGPLLHRRFGGAAEKAGSDEGARLDHQRFEVRSVSGIERLIEATEGAELCRQAWRRRGKAARLW